MSEITFSPDNQARSAYSTLEKLKQRFTTELQNTPGKNDFQPITWPRDDGLHGGGTRFTNQSGELFNRASVNLSHIHFDDLPNKKLSSASALSCIIHPNNPYAPSLHTHISWTKMKGEKGCWRLMADLNPSLNGDLKESFQAALAKTCSEELCQLAFRQGDAYFYIPALRRHRGVAHFYLEGHTSGDFHDDLRFADTFGNQVINHYVATLKAQLSKHSEYSQEEKERQLAYHTLYFFQVLTLDKGTTTGLLAHNQNDIGTLASLPAYINKELLASWHKLMPEPQGVLLENLLAALPQPAPCPVGDEVKPALCQVIRDHYNKFPEALSLQASLESLEVHEQ
ncbi:MAG: coproporphyrinogen III oxidase [Planctomycetes bacterium]|nr:coproporphyrinogen III oxidase [Planctomycetota bacterium]